MENLQVKTLREKDVGIRCDGSMRMGADESCISPKVGHWGGCFLTRARRVVHSAQSGAAGACERRGMRRWGATRGGGARAGSFHPKALQPINPVGK